MLDQNDLKQINDLFEHRFNRIDEKFARVEENFASVIKKIDFVDQKFTNELKFVNQTMKTFSEHFDERVDLLTTHVDKFFHLHQKLD